MIVLMNCEFQIWKAVANDGARPTLNYVNVQSDPGVDPGTDGMIPGTAVATDGYVLAVVPIMLDMNDQPGLIAVSVFLSALKVARAARPKTADLYMDLRKQPGEQFITTVGLADGSRVLRYDDDKDKDGNYPDWQPIVPDRMQPKDRDNQPALMAASFQPSNFTKICQAIGCRIALDGRGSKSGDGDTRIVFGRAVQSGVSYDPFIVEPIKATIGQKFIPPFGLIMPLSHQPDHKPGGYWYQEEKRNRF